MNHLFQLKNIPAILLFVVILSTSNSCGTNTFGLRADSLFLVTDHSSIYYDLKRPVEKHFLPYVLAEISGLTHKSSAKLLAVDDETGKIFEYDTKAREIIHSMEFFKPSDFEGVEMVGEHVYALKSDGDIFRFSYSESKKVTAEKFENALAREHDTEGLGFDYKQRKLLILCKEKAGIGDNKVKGRAVYTMDIDSHELEEEPFFTIRVSNLVKFWESNRSFDYEEERVKFKPSAIAHHPIDDTFYVLSSVGKLLVIVDRSGEIIATYPISPRVLSQPEGICFAPNGDMYISSEGEGDRGYIVKFEMKRK